MNFGPQTSEADSFAIMDKALELGMNFWDTADVYGWVPGEAVTENILGRWFAGNKARRSEVVLATKVFGDMNLKGRHNPNLERGLSAGKIIRGCENSLRRMKTDYLDLFQMHHIDRSCPWDEIWQAMETLVRQGKVLYVGSSNFAGWDIATANQVASQRHFLGLVSEQSVYNLENRTVELEVIPACRHYGLGLMVWSPLSQGLLAGALKKQRAGRRSGGEFEKRVAAKRKQLEAYESLCRKLKANPAIVGMAWVLHNPVVTAPIVGPRTVGQLVESLDALELKLDAATLKKLDEIWPGPGGEAPRAYAW